MYANCDARQWPGVTATSAVPSQTPKRGHGAHAKVPRTAYSAAPSGHDAVGIGFVASGAMPLSSTWNASFCGTPCTPRTLSAEKSNAPSLSASVVALRANTCGSPPAAPASATVKETAQRESPREAASRTRLPAASAIATRGPLASTSSASTG